MEVNVDECFEKKKCGLKASKSSSYRGLHNALYNKLSRLTLRIPSCFFASVINYQHNQLCIH